MNTKRKITILSLFSVAAVLVAFLFVSKLPIYADVTDRSIISRQNLNLTLASSSQKSKYVLITKEKDNISNAYFLRLEKSFNDWPTIELKSFEKDIHLSSQLNSDGQDYLFFEGDVGAHARNFFVVRVNNGQLGEIDFAKNTETGPSLVSDLPRFKIQKNGASLDIEAFYRDYNSDPLKNFWSEKYSLNGDKFVFVSQSGIQSQ